jgi:hypothetical protein
MIRASESSARKSSREPARFRSAVDSKGRTIWIADAHRGDGKRFIVRADEKLAAFLELERITHELALSALLGDDSTVKGEISFNGEIC